MIKFPRMMQLFAVVDKCLANSASFLSFVSNAPPPPVVIILLPLKLKIPISPNHPQLIDFFFFILLPKASAASSTNGKFHLEQTFLISLFLQAIQKHEQVKQHLLNSSCNFVINFPSFDTTIQLIFYLVPKDTSQMNQNQYLQNGVPS